VSVQFIEKGYNLDFISKASEQEDQLSYFTVSKLQENILTESYLQQWLNRKYQTDDYFLNWIKSIFKTSNFLLVLKYIRFPLPSARLIKNKIEPQLKRVFNAEDSDFKYDVTGKKTEDFISDLKVKEFNEEIFHLLLYKHNSIVICDLDSEIPNTPHRYFINIKDVVSITKINNRINRIAFRGCVLIENEPINGYVYIDDFEYIFYDNDKTLISKESHDLGKCPAHFISKEKYNNNFFIRQSLFTFIREEIEEYTFLKILQRMTEPNGVIPVVSKLEVEKENNQDNNSNGEPTSDQIMGSQIPGVNSNNYNVGTGDLEPGTIHEIPIESVKDLDGNINMDIIKSYLNFHYTPVEPLNYLNERIKGLETSIVSSIIGDVVSSSEESKNELQIEKSISVIENTLYSFSEVLNRIRKLSDVDMLRLKYSPNLVNEVFIHYGTDFFLDSQTKLFEDLKNAPNALERKNITLRISQNRYKNNIDQLSRQTLLYNLMPYVSDTDFNKAVDLEMVDNSNKEYQLRFTYWISQFEANFGDIVTFYKEIDLSNAEKLTIINNLIIELISKQIKSQENDESDLRTNEEDKQLQSGRETDN